MSKCPNCHQAIDCTGLSGVVECPICKKRFNCTPARPTPVVASPLPEALPAQPEELQFTFDSPVSSSRRFLNKKKKPTTLWDFIDLGFQHYLTPIIIKIIWALCLGLAALGLAVAAFAVIRSSFPESDHSQQSRSSDVRYDSRPTFQPSSSPSAYEQWSTALVYKILGWIAFAISTAIILLIVRVICESIIVLFNIAESLTSIDKKTRAVI